MSEQTTAEWRKEFDERMAHQNAVLNGEPSPRETKLALQVRLLADRLAMAMALMQGCETDCGLAGDSEGADAWESARRMLIGKDDEALEYEREQMRKFGEYQAALTQVRSWIKRELERG